MKFILLISLVIFTSLPSYSHEGDHHLPGTVEAQKGGVVRSLETVNLELIEDNNKLTIYVFDSNTPSKALSAKSYPVDFKIKIRNKKEISPDVKTEENHWSILYTAPKGTHRYTLTMKIEQGGHNDTIKWNIEPKRDLENE